MDRNAMLRLLDPGWGRPSLFTGHRLLSALREVCGSPLIEDLSIDFTAVAVGTGTLSIYFCTSIS